MDKPTFEAMYNELTQRLVLSISNPEGVIGDFGGYEILTKSGHLGWQDRWDSLAVLATEKRYFTTTLEKQSAAYVFTVRGRVPPNCFSEMADPVEFRRLNKELSAPQNVRIKALDSHTLYMTWTPPAKNYGIITGYVILWTHDLSTLHYTQVISNHVYRFSSLKAQQNVSAAVYAESRPRSHMKFKYLGSFSDFVTATTLPS
ncbi:unnamed protein product [Hydatigera taeniaeformis]|uniref:Fibronectin type-III domain-containing protein n=1 Tax=Hydatigena taeniaeformis TaxID=6205 RepID=A0A0R3WPY7_HYDTA|nr:unnamed protein product [Hydatigera taeniaeformis]